MTIKEDIRRAPVQGDQGWELDKLGWGGRYLKALPPGSITWEEHIEAWHVYAALYPGQSAERLAARGGFGHDELRDFLGHDPRTFEIHPACIAKWDRVKGPFLEEQLRLNNNDD
jgi:hypothetical protein